MIADQDQVFGCWYLVFGIWFAAICVNPRDQFQSCVRSDFQISVISENQW